ncbi:MAG: ArsR/SmtB family transcription factor [Candidatus Sericytochromatia bacterium]
MPFREVVTQELANLLGVLAHHDRILIVEELQRGEREVKALQQHLKISHSRVSQHLALLRSHKVVAERRQGRHVLYRLLKPDLSGWLMDALKFIEFRLQHSDEILSAVESARQMWQTTDPAEPSTTEGEASLLYIRGRGRDHAEKKNLQASEEPGAGNAR